MKKVKYILAAAIVLFCLAGGYVYLVYQGYVQCNNPSKIKYPVRGVDVSHYQGEIDWAVLVQQNIMFAYIKATEGSSHVDRKFHENWMNAKKTGLKIGAYHFFSFDSPGSTQAENFISHTEAFPGMLPPVVDVEYYGDKEANPPQEDEIRRELSIFLNIVEQHYGMIPVIYSTENVWERYINGHYDSYPLWIRNVITKPVQEADWTFWQYTNRARLKGYAGEEKFIDINVFWGTIEEWHRFCD